MQDSTKKSCCCDSADSSPCCRSEPPVVPQDSHRPRWIKGKVTSPIGDIPVAATTLSVPDRLGAWRMRWGIGRLKYRVEPGLYAVGQPDAQSPVLVSANYKLSFDRLRCELAGRNAWILVIDSRGVNVWCAAGKGTFGTDELVRCIAAFRLTDVVTHRTVVVPQLGAPGVAAHELRKQNGFRVVFGPVRAADIPAFLDAGMKATPDMRRVRFPLGERLAVVPVDLVQSVWKALAVAVALLLLAGLGTDGYCLARTVGQGIPAALCFLSAYLAGTVLTPALLPWIPGRALAAKGAWVGLALSVGAAIWTWEPSRLLQSSIAATAWILLIVATTSFMAMLFTGSTTYTSLSGVRREMRFAVPLQAATCVIGLVLWMVGRFL